MRLIDLQTSAMQRDSTTRALCNTLDVQLDNTSNEVKNALIYPGIDRLKNEVLDELAWQFDVSGYSVLLSLEQKIKLVKNAIKVHRYAGTAYAVKSALSSIYQNAWIEEWFESNGIPYTFKAFVNYLGDTQNDNMQSVRNRIIDVIKQTKNERSKLTSVCFVLQNKANVKVGTYHSIATSIIIAPYKVENIKQALTLKTGAKMKYANTIKIIPQGGNA